MYGDIRFKLSPSHCNQQIGQNARSCLGAWLNGASATSICHVRLSTVWGARWENASYRYDETLSLDKEEKVERSAALARQVASAAQRSSVHCPQA